MVQLNGSSKLKHSELAIYLVIVQPSVTTNSLFYKNYQPKRSALRLGWLLPAFQNLALMANNIRLQRFLYLCSCDSAMCKQ